MPLVVFLFVCSLNSCFLSLAERVSASMALLSSVALNSLYIFIAGVLLYTIYGAIWRLYLSPLAKFPGPKLAALTLWYVVSSS